MGTGNGIVRLEEGFFEKAHSAAQQKCAIWKNVCVCVVGGGVAFYLASIKETSMEICVAGEEYMEVETAWGEGKSDNIRGGR